MSDALGTLAYRSPRDLGECHNIADLRQLSRRRLPRPIFDYLDGAAEDEQTAARNTAAFNENKLIPNCLVDVSSVTTSARILGQEIKWPVLCSPAGVARMYDSEGELAIARAAARAGTFYGLSIASSHSLEDVARASPGPKLFQLYIFRDRGITRELIERCRTAGYAAICLTVDCAVRGNRERELRTGLGIPLKLSMRGTASLATHPRWVVGLLHGGPLTMPNLAGCAGSDNIAVQTRFLNEHLDPSVTWKDAREMIELWGGPFAIKGVMSVEDARRAVAIGASAVIISNHGGRQLDGAAAPMEVLPEIAEAVGDRIEVILEGGIRRGTHVLKALARGAKACSVGRPYLYGLGAAAEAGVDKALAILRTELVRAMQLAGCTDVNRVDSSIVRRF